jgi:hypothetical protein
MGFVDKVSDPSLGLGLADISQSTMEKKVVGILGRRETVLL